MLEMDAYDEPDPDSDLDYEESYTKRSKRRKTTGRVSAKKNKKIILCNMNKYDSAVSLFYCCASKNITSNFSLY